MENTDLKENNSKPAFEFFVYLGAVQLLPILLLLVLSCFGTFFMIYELVNSISNNRSNISDYTIILFIIIITIGLILGFISSFLFFIANSVKSLKTLNQGIICNAIAWCILSLVYLFLATRPDFL